MAPEDWKAETLTARHIVAQRDVVLSIHCQGCRLITEADAWKVGARLADTPLQRLRFRCRRCGVYADAISVGRRTSTQGVHLLDIPLKPACWDEGHQADQAAALSRTRQLPRE